MFHEDTSVGHAWKQQLPILKYTRLHDQNNSVDITYNTAELFNQFY